MLSIERTPQTMKTEIKISNALCNFREGIREGANNAGRSIQKRITTMLSSGTRTGHKYFGLSNRSSAPGEYPRSQSGKLLNSIYYHGNSTNDFRIGATAKHAVYLEDGTYKMSARPNPSLPWMQLAMELEEGNIDNYLQRGPERRLC